MFWKAAAGVLITVVLGLTLKKQQDLSLVLTMAACSMVGILVLSYLEPVLEFLQELEISGNLQEDMLGILLKAAGIGMVGELAGMVCTDGGNASLGKTIQLLANTVILYLSLPMMRTMLELIRKILGAL